MKKYIASSLPWGKKEYLRKKELLFRIMVDNSQDYNSAAEALNILLDLIGDVDLTVASIDKTNVNIIASTIENDENIGLLSNEIKRRMLSDIGFTKERMSLRSRADLEETRIVPLIIGGKPQGYLYVDVYGEVYLDDYDFSDIFEILAVIIRLCNLEHNRTLSLKTDNLTRLLTRDSLISDIKDIIDADFGNEVQLAVLYICNAAWLNQTKGIAAVDDILLRIAKELMKENETNVYRIGGMKFALLTHKDIQAACMYMQDTIDNLRLIDKDLTVSIIVVPILDDAYKTVYLCEKNIKTVESDNVTIFRNEPSESEQDAYMKAVSTVIPKSNEVKYVEDSQPAVFDVMRPENTEVLESEVIDDEEECIVNDFFTPESETETDTDYSNLVIKNDEGEENEEPLFFSSNIQEEYN